MAWNAALLLTLSSAIAVPGPGRLGTDKTIVAPPGSSGPTGRGGQSSSESPEQRQFRLQREGIRQVEPPPPSMDYVSVLKRQVSAEGSIVNAPPSLWFGFGFASWFPFRESPGRKSTPFGSYHLFAEIYSLGERKKQGERCFSAQICRFDSLQLFALSTVGALELPGSKERNGESTRFSVEVSDLDWGAAWRSERLEHWDSAGTYQLAFGLMLGWLPLRQRSIVQYGDSLPADKDLLHSGLQFNSSGFMSRVSVAALALSRFEAGVFAGLNMGFPSEVKASIGFEFALRDPMEKPQATGAEKLPSPVQGQSESKPISQEPDQEQRPTGNKNQQVDTTKINKGK